MGGIRGGKAKTGRPPPDGGRPVPRETAGGARRARAPRPASGPRPSLRPAQRDQGGPSAPGKDDAHDSASARVTLCVESFMSSWVLTVCSSPSSLRGQWSGSGLHIFIVRDVPRRNSTVTRCCLSLAAPTEREAGRRPPGAPRRLWLMSKATEFYGITEKTVKRQRVPHFAALKFFTTCECEMSSTDSCDCFERDLVLASVAHVCETPKHAAWIIT